MGATLYFSNQLMPLADKLSENLMLAGDASNLLQPSVVIVPNTNLSKWIKLILARKSDIFMNVEFQYLENGLWQMIRSLDPKTGAESELMDLSSLRILLFFILLSTDRKIPELMPVSRYLFHFDGRLRSDIEIRCWQLCEQLARLYQEYEYHRSDMIHSWLADRPAIDTMEACQKWIYLKMRSLKAQLGRSTGQWLRSIAEYAWDMRSWENAGKQWDCSGLPPVHFFGLSQISHFHLQLLIRLKSCFDIHIYSLNPSREYWEDIKTPFEKRWIERKGVGGLKLTEDEWSAGTLFSEVDHPLLSAWGKPGRESIRLLCQLTDYDFNAGFAEYSRPQTVLAAVAKGLLTLDAQATETLPLNQDTSLQVLACPGIRREVETVYDSILYNLETDPNLCMTDIAVMVSDMSRYKPVVDSVFNRQPARIDYNLVDSNARTESVFAQAVLALMNLSRGSFSRKQVFDLLRNPCVMQRWGYAPEALSIWIRWADALGIFNGYENTATEAQAGSSAGPFSWRQGLERLRIARIMALPDDVAGGPKPHFNGIVPYADINTGDVRLLEKFCALIESLHATVLSLRMVSAQAQTWRDIFFRAVDRLVVISAEMHGEESVYQSLVSAFEHFVRYDALNQLRPGRPLTADALWAFVQTHLEAITGGQGDYLTGGVTVSALMPMRPIPFKVVYVLGLEEGRFPGREVDSLLDLRSRNRRIGDITPAERNRYLFLEVLISVHRKLYLSYLSRDLQKDRALAPCSVVHQLRRYVEQHVLGGRPFNICRIPIQADSPAYLAPNAINGWSDALVNSSIVQRLSCYRRHGLWDAFESKAASAELQTAERYRPDFSFSKLPAANDSSERVPLTIDQLRRFLLDPVGVLGHFHLGIGEYVDPTVQLAAIEDEPLFSQFPIDFNIRTTPVNNWLAAQVSHSNSQQSQVPLEIEFEAVYADLSRKSRVPAGIFGDHDKSKFKQEVIALGELLYPYVEQMRSARQRFSAIGMGEGIDDYSQSRGDRLHFNPLSIKLPDSEADGRVDTVQLSGSIPWVWQSADGSWHSLVVTGANKRPRFPDKYIIAPLLTFMAITAGDEPYPWSDHNRMSVHIVYREHVLNLDYPLDPLRSADYLRDLAVDFLTPSPLVWLPFETIFFGPGLRAQLDQDRVSTADRKLFYEAMLEARQAAADVRTELTGAIVPPDILDRARRRFGIFLP